jgi:CRP/FNR family transcriptional regulator, cyclic AMP receptor protein
MNATDTSLHDALRDSRLAQDLTPEQLGVLATVVRLADCRAKDVLAREGASDNHLYAVVEGSLGVVKHLGTPEETQIATLHVGDFAHELGFLDGAQRYASLVASSGTRVLVLEREGLEGLIDTHPRIVYAVMRTIVRTVHQIQTRLSMQAMELTNYIVKQHGRY